MLCNALKDPLRHDATAKMVVSGKFQPLLGSTKGSSPPSPRTHASSATLRSSLRLLRLPAHHLCTRTSIQLCRKRARLVRLLLLRRRRITCGVLGIRARRGTHARTGGVVDVLALRLWCRVVGPNLSRPSMAPLLRILPPIHRQWVGTRSLAGGGDGLRRPCLLAVCDAEGCHCGTLLLHGRGKVLRW